MIKILRGEVFISLMQAVLLASLFEIFFGQNYVNSTVVSVALLLSSIGLLSGLTIKATTSVKR